MSLPTTGHSLMIYRQRAEGNLRQTSLVYEKSTNGTVYQQILWRHKQ